VWLTVVKACFFNYVNLIDNMLYGILDELSLL